MRDWEGTIVARVTPLGHGGVAIVRVSGPSAYAVVDAFCETRAGSSVVDLPERNLVACVVRDGDAIWDRGLMVRFGGPRSFTGEDVVELHLHGNPLIVERVVELAVAAGARMAGPGEFTMRAVLNGKLDLLQAEAVAEAVAAESREAIELAQRQLGGALSRRLDGLRRRVLDAIARLELELDFAEEGYAFLSSDDLRSLVDDLRTEVGSLLRSFRSAGRLRTGPRVLLLGRPNAGKSSFFNSVLGYSRSLVSDVAGTTRDYLEERVVRNGLVLRLVDTAGLRAADDAVEAEGVRRAWELGRDADVALYLVDSTDDGAIAAAPEEVSAFRGTFPDVDVLTVFTKQDRTAARFGEFGVSAIDEASVDAMLDIVAERCRPALDGVSALVTHRQAVELDRMKQLLDIIDISSDALLVATDLRELLHPLEQLTGAVGNEDVLDQVFGGFCIGK